MKILGMILVVLSIFDWCWCESSHPPYLRLPLEGQVQTIDPSLTFDMSSIELTEQLFLGLTNYIYQDSVYKIVPELATQWTIHEKGSVYRFQLRQDIFWVNGYGERIRPVTAHDIVWAIHRNINPKTDAPYASALFILKNASDIFHKKKDINTIGVRALNDYLVEFTLTYAASYFPAMLTMWIFRPLPKEIVEKFADQWTMPENILTNGAYRLTEWKKRRRIILQSNANYNDHLNTIPEIRYYIVPESFAALNMYTKNKLDIVGGNYTRFSPMGIFRINKLESLKPEHIQTTRFAVYSYHFNAIRPPMDNLFVRKAITSAIDRVLLVDVITKGGEQPASTFTHPGFLGIKDNMPYPDTHFDPNKAKEYLKKAGYPNGDHFPELILCYDISDTHHVIARSFQIMLKHYLNIDVVLAAKEWGDFIDAIDQADKNKVPHIFRFGWASDYLDANNFLNEALTHSRNFSGWTDNTFDLLLLQARQETNLSKRLAIYQQAETIITSSQVAIVPLYYETDHYLVKPWIKNFFPMPIGGQHIEKWEFSDAK
jgi:ABC-type oligopeptide transport system substrate-binding subunit